MKLEKIIEKVSQELGIPEDTIIKTYKAYWEYIRSTIQELPLKKDLSLDEFSKLKTNFNIPSLGKLSCTYDRMVNMKKRLEYINKIRKRYD